MTNKKIAAEWRRLAVSPHQWTVCANQAGADKGEAGGYFVETASIPRRCYLKPADPHVNAANYARAAREKIASDLAYDLHLPVPPAILTTRPSPPPGCESAVVVSLVMYPVQYSWMTVKASIALNQLPVGLAFASALKGCSSMWVFDTWLDQVDHGDHPHNIVWGYSPKRLSDSQIVFLDYAFSMGFSGSWTNGRWQTVQLAPFPQLMRDNIDHTRLRITLEKIEAYSDTEIRQIVDRIPSTHLADQEKLLIIEGLIGRKNLLRAQFTQLISTSENEAQ